MNVLDKAAIDVTAELALEGFQPHYGGLAETFPAGELWQALGDTGSQLWLDTGDRKAAAGLWVRQFAALTTNNSLLNKEVQKGTYDGLVRRAADALRGALGEMDRQELIREIAFVLNAYHGLRLVEQFDAHVSVELHTDVADDVDATVGYARRYHHICPERFIVKIPLTAAGLIAAHKLSDAGVPVNFTLGFSARQNVLVALLARPAYCNVFLGRLNQVCSANELGDGANVGERAVAASQAAIRRLRQSHDVPTRQIAASIRHGGQIRDLAGVDVFTMPPKAAEEFLALGLAPRDLKAFKPDQFTPTWADGVEPTAWGFNTLWDVPDKLIDAVAEMCDRGGSDCNCRTLTSALAKAGFADVLPAWSAGDITCAAADGKIPKLAQWRDRLAAGGIGLDALMTLSGLLSFAADQQAMDKRIAGCLP